MDTLKKSFKGNVSFKHTRKISAGGVSSEINHEELPILLNHQSTDHHLVNDSDPSDRTEVILKIDDSGSSAVSRSLDSVANNGGKVWRESRYDFWNNDETGIGESASRVRGARMSDSGDDGNEGFQFVQTGYGMEDPPTKLIGDFLHKQKIRGETTLDMDLEMEELKPNRIIPPLAESPLSQTSKDLKVSFQQDSTEISSNDQSMRRRYRDSHDLKEEFKGEQPPWQQSHHERLGSPTISGVQNESLAEAMRCASNLSFHSELSFQRKSNLLRAKTKSRLTDPPAEPDRLSGLIPKSGQLRSGFLGKIEDDDDDPFLEDDLPDDFKRGNFTALTVLQWFSLILITAAFICTLSVPYLREKSLWELDIWKWEVMILILICGRLVSGWGIRIAVFFIERNFLLRKRVLYFVYGVRKPVQNCLWLGLVLIAWHLLFNKRVEKQTNTSILNYVSRVLVCLLISTLIWLVKTLMVKVLASSFHVSTYFDRIQESLFNQYVIETLSGPPLVEIRKNEEEEERIADEVQKLQNAGLTIPPDLKATFASIKSGRAISSERTHKSFCAKSSKFSRALTKNGNDGITIDHLHKLSPKNVSAWNMKRLLNIVRYGSISTLDEQIRGPCLDDESTTEIKSEREAKAAAKKIFQNVARRGYKYIYLDDLMRFMREDEVLKTTSLFEGAAENRRISKSVLKNWVVNVFRERRALALTLNDTKTAVDKLHHMVNVIFGILILILWLIVLGIASSKFFIFLSSQIVVVAFIFGNTCKTIFEAIIFLFVMHPFDVGDRCEIDGTQMVVEEMNILTTVFLRYDNLKIIIPNSVLATKLIHNFYRSPDMGESVEFFVHIATPAEKITAMKQRIISYIEGNKEHWCPAPMIVFKDIDGLNKLKLAVWLSHRMNHQDSAERWARRSVLVEEVVKVCQELDIQYRLLPIDINIRSLPSSAPSIGFPSNWTSPAS
ncbi:mechanosensitive ion channel protein 6-like [Cucumis melo var. makuwa]|uniref:Mechanosensitive ion channel protein n=1 Tax=Cucumis melo var. makuwa TaxID=1194695 RepID=A0A5D3DI81_CUCMM|nr:mechanosensitive ion channel protein 6-like [Cucumis melo var. makuwa]TYK23381.1 mechanosensitive ion channel protein 6-like [Cucumis melo var. makuwa]